MAIEDPKAVNEYNINLTEEREDPRRDRRLQDGIASKNSLRDMKLDSRTLSSDRRFSLDSGYKGKPVDTPSIDEKL